jgi:3-dehydroquinate synthase
MPTFPVRTPSASYDAIVERGALAQLKAHIPPRAGRVFAVSTPDVWQLYRERFTAAMGGREFDVIEFAGGEERKRMSEVEVMAEAMLARGADRSSLVIGFGGGITTDLAGFLAAIFMRGVPVIQIPTTLLAQVDAGVGGKTGANLVSGKNLIGAFHQPLVVLTDPDLLATLPAREYVAGLFEVLKSGIIRSPELFRVFVERPASLLRREAAPLEFAIAESVRIKCEVVSADEKEGGLRRILNFGHTVGHAIEAETAYKRYLHGEAVALGMKAAIHISHLTGRLPADLAADMLTAIDACGAVPSAADLSVANLCARLAQDKKTLQGSVHFVLTSGPGETEVVSGLPLEVVREAVATAIQ